MNLVKKVKFGKIHCFPFSAKKGTRAATFVDTAPEIKKDRMNRLSSIAEELQKEYNLKYVGKGMEMLIEETEGDYLVGYSENYIKCYLPNNKNIVIGSIIKVKGLELYKEGLKVEYGK